MPCAFAEVVPIIRDIVVAAAAATTAIVAVLGLNSWNRELKGKVTFEVARSLARSTYRVRDAIAAFRSPWVPNVEFPDWYQELDSRTAKQEADAWAHVYANRWKPVLAAIQEFDAHALEAETLWGDDVRAKTKELVNCANELYVAAAAVIDDKASDERHFESDREFGRSMRAKVSASLEDDDNPLTKRIVAAVREIEGVLRSHLRQP